MLAYLFVPTTVIEGYQFIKSLCFTFYNYVFLFSEIEGYVYASETYT